MMARILALLSFLLIGTLPASGAEAKLRGITVSCQTFGPEWATPEMAATLDEIKTLGANAFAIHPYAKIAENGAIRFSTEAAPPEIVQPARWAREKNLQMMLIPHLAYWGTKFSWRGEIDFATEAEWKRFFTDYTRWITGLAVVCEAEKIPILSIGLEYHRAVHREAEWREIIRQVRAVYRGKLTYGANWDDFREVPFWDALDSIGILAYFPLSTKDQQNPDETILRAAWKKWLGELSAYSQKMGKPILFVELGYNESSDAAAHPWAYQTGGPNAEELQERCLRVALEETAKADFLEGVFLWKWFPTYANERPENFDLRKPAPRSAIRAAWQNAAPAISVD
ncbi:MAG TPA: hypothetical protein VF585_05715 [Chthoniobacterales bacterium]|jgi:hypothetical protein